MQIPIYKPYLPKNSLRFAHDALDSTWLSSQGKYIQMATEKLQEVLGAPYLLLTNNGTTACHLMAKTNNYFNKSPFKKKQIIVPNNVYVAAWNAFLFDKDYVLIPVDANLNTWNVDIEQLKNTIKTYPLADILIAHNIGNVINVPQLKKEFPDRVFLEDNCEGLFGKYDNQFTGTSSYISAISFFGNKNITTGEGGGIITQSEEAYNYAKLLHGQGQSNKRFVHSELGYNYRITNVQAALLYGQLEILPEVLSKKNDIFQKYQQAFKDREDIKIQTIMDNTKSANWMFGVRIPDSSGYEVAESFFKLKEIEIRPMFYSIKEHEHLKNNFDVFECDCQNAVLLNKECIILPSFPELHADEQKWIIKSVNEYIQLTKGKCIK